MSEKNFNLNMPPSGDDGRKKEDQPKKGDVGEKKDPDQSKEKDKEKSSKILGDIRNKISGFFAGKKSKEKEFGPENERLLNKELELLGLNEEKLKNCEDFNDLSEGAKVLVLRNIRQLVLKGLSAESINEARKNFEDASEGEGLMGKFKKWRGKLKIGSEAKKIKKEKIKELAEKGISDDQIAILNESSKGVAMYEINFEKAEDGKESVSFLEKGGSVSDEMVSKFNDISNKLSEMSLGAAHDSAKKKDRKNYEKLHEEYEKIKEEIIKENPELAKKLSKAQAQMNLIRTLKSDSVLEEEWKDASKNPGFFRKILSNMTTKEGLTYLASGALLRRGSSALSLTLAASASVTPAIAMAGAGVGAFRGYKRAEKNLRKGDEKALYEKKIGSKEREEIKKEIEKLVPKEHRFNPDKWIIGGFSYEKDGKKAKLEDAYTSIEESLDSIQNEIIKNRKLLNEGKDVPDFAENIKNRDKLLRKRDTLVLKAKEVLLSSSGRAEEDDKIVRYLNLAEKLKGIDEASKKKESKDLNVLDSSSLSDKLDSLVEKLEKEMDIHKKRDIIRALISRVSFTKEKLAKDLIRFKNKVDDPLVLSNSLIDAELEILAYKEDFESPVAEVQKRLDSFLATIGLSRDEARKKYKRNVAIKSAIFGGVVAGAGSLLFGGSAPLEEEDPGFEVDPETGEGPEEPGLEDDPAPEEETDPETGEGPEEPGLEDEPKGGETPEDDADPETGEGPEEPKEGDVTEEGPDTSPEEKAITDEDLANKLEEIGVPIESLTDAQLEAIREFGPDNIGQVRAGGNISQALGKSVDDLDPASFIFPEGYEGLNDVPAGKYAVHPGDLCLENADGDILVISNHPPILDSNFVNRIQGLAEELDELIENGGPLEDLIRVSEILEDAQLTEGEVSDMGLEDGLGDTAERIKLEDVLSGSAQTAESSGSQEFASEALKFIESSDYSLSTTETGVVGPTVDTPFNDKIVFDTFEIFSKLKNITAIFAEGGKEVSHYTVEFADGGLKNFIPTELESGEAVYIEEEAVSTGVEDMGAETEQIIRNTSEEVGKMQENTSNIMNKVFNGEFQDKDEFFERLKELKGVDNLSDREKWLMGGHFERIDSSEGSINANLQRRFQDDLMRFFGDRIL